MKNLTLQLKNKLTGLKHLVVLGVGSELRSDDAAGIVTANLIKENIPDAIKNKVTVLIGETAPENLTGEIKKIKPTHLLIIDAADISKKHGEVSLFEPKDIKGISFCTHQLPMSIMIEYLKSSITCQVLIVGIQPKSLNFGSNLSKEVALAVECVSDAVLGAIGNNL